MKNLASIIILSLSIVFGANANTYIVSNTNDAGAGSLREAISQANANSGADQVEFNIPGAGPHEIVLQSPLPFITDPININGYSQPGALQASSNSPAKLKIALKGGAGAGDFGLSLGDKCTVKGLAIYSFPTAINVAGNDNRVTGCHIGLDVAGSTPIGNTSNGIIITGRRNRIGGAGASLRNVISGNFNGVAVFPGASNNVIQGNYVGTDATGKSTISDNGFDGIALSSSNNRILNNVVVGHENNNILIGRWSGNSALPSGNIIKSNRIGHHADGSFSSFTNNCQGVSINMAKNTLVQSNIIYGNGCHGVLIDGAAATGNLVSKNSIYGNLGIAINLGLDWVTPNDPGDSDSGPNQLQNFPVLEEARISASKTKVKGFIDTRNPQTVRLEFYVNPTLHPSWHGDGKKLIGTAFPQSNGKISANLPSVSPGSFISAIAIDRNNNTSEFSMSVKAWRSNENAGANATISLSNAKAETEASLSVKAFPNPFFEETSISYRLPEGQSIKLSVFNAAGRLIEVLRDDYQEAGSYEMRFDATRLPAGLYFYQLVAGGKTHSGKLILK